MAQPDLFVEWYDALFSDKPYANEIACVLRVAEQHLTHTPREVLELGVGTGNHALALARRGLRVTGVEPNPAMFAKAKDKTAANPGVTLHQGYVDDVPQRGFELCVALFHVVNYLRDRETLVGTLRSVAERLAPRGLFIFDCWNGVAALRDPPQTTRREIRHRDRTLICELTPDTDLLNQRCTMRYHLEVQDEVAGSRELFHSSVEHRIWTPLQIEDATREAGLATMAICPAFAAGSQATHTDWKIMFVCERSG